MTQTAKGLPGFAYAVHPVTGDVIIIRNGQSGYQMPVSVEGDAEKVAKALNESAGVSPAQAEAMLAGSMFGWDCPAADPAHYE